MHQIQQIQAKISQFQQNLSSIASMVQELASSERANQQQLQQLSQKEQYASRQLQQIQSMCQSAVQEIQHLTSLTNQISQSMSLSGSSYQGSLSGSIGSQGVSYVPNISTYTQPSATAGFSEVSSSPTGRPDYGVGSGSYGMGGISSYSGYGGGSYGVSQYGISSGMPQISTATQPSATAGFSEVNSSPTGRPDYGVGSGSYGMSGGSSFSGLGGGGYGMSGGSSYSGGSGYGMSGYGISSYGSGNIPSISTATQPSPKAGVSDSSYSPTGNPDIGSSYGSYGMSGGSLNASLGRS